MALAAFMRLYPWLHMLQEGLSFSYQLAYLLQASPYFSPTLHVLRQHVERASGQQLVSFFASSAHHHNSQHFQSGCWYQWCPLSQMTQMME